MKLANFDRSITPRRSESWNLRARATRPLIMACLSAILFYTSFVGGDLRAQWKQLATFSGTVTSIYFMRGECNARVGFVGTQGWSVQKTTDGGTTWRQVLFANANPFYVSGFEFKDSLTGWCTISEFAAKATTNTVWMTTDGGETWRSLGISGCHPDVYYNPFSKKLLISSWSGSDLVSSDDGQTFAPFAPPLHNGFAFITPTNGLLTSVNGTQRMLTVDGGATWTYTNADPAEAFKPFVIPCTTSYLCAEEGFGTIKRSDDGGQTWTQLFNFFPNPALTGDIVGDADHLFIQRTVDVQESTDQGKTWKPIGGPGNTYDTKMAVRGGFLFAGDLAGHLLRYAYGGTQGQLAQLQLSTDTLSFISAGCAIPRKTLGLSAVTACAECVDSLRLIAATITGSTFFTLGQTPDPSHGITGNDSIVVIHNTATALSDTATLLLTFNEYVQQFTRVVTLVGANIPHASTQVGLTTLTNRQQAQLHAGDTLRVVVYLKGPVSKQVGLSTVTCDLPFERDPLTYLGATGLNGWTIGATQANQTSIGLALNSPSHDSPAGERMAEVDFLVEVTGTRNSEVSIDSVHFNAGDPNFENCFLTSIPPTDSIGINEIDACGDSLMRGVLLKRSLLSVLGVTPDPVLTVGGYTAVQLHINSGISQPVSITLSDVTGREVGKQTTAQLLDGTNDIRLDLTGLSEGAYMVRVASSTSVATTKLVLQSSGK